MTIILDHGTRRQFVKDYKLPIQVVQDPYFDYYLDLYEDQFKTRTRYNLLIKTIEQYGSLDAYLKESRRVREEAIDFIKNQDAYNTLAQDRLDHLDLSNFARKSNLYNQLNVGKTFVSIDLVTANVQAFNFYDKAILDNSPDYKTFLSKFTDQEYFFNSKQIRQVIFGNLLPKKQQKIQQFIMLKVLNVLVDMGLDKKAIEASSPDELVFELKELPNYQDFLNAPELQDFNFHVDVFELDNIHEEVEVLIKRFKNKDGIEIKSTNSKHMAEVYKHIVGLPPHEYDTIFFDEGRIAKYLEPLLKPYI